MNKTTEKEIDLIDLLKKIYSSRRIVLYSFILFSFIGIVIALISPIKFTSNTVFIPLSQKSSSSNSISGVASLVGINLNNSFNGNEIPYTLYPKVAESVKFKRMLLESIIDKKNNITLKSFLTNSEKNTGDDNDININSEMFISYNEEKLFEKISKIITISINQQDGLITINANSPVAEYSANIAYNSREILQKIIINYRIESAKQNLDYTEKLLREKKLVYDDIQSKLAYFSDSNINSVNSFLVNEKSKLDGEFQIIKSVVTELSKQVEQAKLQVSKDTPVFSTIKEAVIPNLRESPKRKMIVLQFGIIGLIVGVLYVLLESYIRNIIKEIKN